MIISPNFNDIKVHHARDIINRLLNKSVIVGLTNKGTQIHFDVYNLQEILELIQPAWRKFLEHVLYIKTIYNTLLGMEKEKSFKLHAKKCRSTIRNKKIGYFKAATFIYHFN